MADDSPQNQPALVDRDPKAPQTHALDASREQFYLPRYQPSAPPEPFFNHADELSHEEALHDDPYQKPSGLPPGTRLVDILSDAFGRFWRTSHTVLRLDLRRSINVDPITRIRESDSPRRPYRGRGRQGYSEDWGEEGPSSSWFQGIHGGGARMKLMQVWDFPNKESGLPSLPGNLNFGCGAAIETDGGGHLELEARIKAKHAALYILPSPLLQLHGKWAIPGTPLAVDVRYRVPLVDLEKVWESPAAQLFVNLYNPVGTGFHLTPGGIEFDEHVVNIGQHTKMRVAASIQFPRALPLEEGERPLRVQINRLGIKSRIS